MIKAYYQVMFSGFISSILLTQIPDLSILIEVLISFGVSFITIIGSKFINYLSRKLDDPGTNESSIDNVNEITDGDKHDTH